MMATDINTQVANAYDAAKQALNDDLKQNFYNAAQARMTAFRQINNNANAQHSLYSGRPMAAQMQYDASEYVPGLGSAVVKAVNQQETNQKSWDDYMEYVNKLNSAADEYRKAANQNNSNANIMTNAVAGYKNKPTGRKTYNIVEEVGNYIGDIGQGISDTVGKIVDGFSNLSNK